MAMSADELRQVIREMMPDLDDRARGRMASSIVSRAARDGSGWVPAALDDTAVGEAVAFAQAAAQAGQADPADVDEHLRRGNSAFLRHDYAAAYRIFAALIPAIAEGEIDLGQDEMVDEVLGVDVGECAIRLVVSAYMTADPARRPEAVRTAIDETSGVGYFAAPIREMERAAGKALPGLEDFLPRWRALLESEAAREQATHWDRDADRWLREVVERLGGADGLARLARSTRRANDLRAWCESLAAAADWPRALAAFEEAAASVTDSEHARGEFLDGAALAAQEMGEEDVSPWLERAWRAEPTMARLRRWLGAARSGESLRRRATQALDACPPEAQRQRAFLHLVQGDVGEAAQLLKAAPGLGWSESEHPGHLVFPLFQRLLGGSGRLAGATDPAEWAMDRDDFELFVDDRDDEPRLATPKPEDILRLAGVEGVSSAAARTAALAAMRTAAERRVAGVAGAKRRQHYGHAASLVAACVASDGSPEATRWAEGLRTEYRRFRALCAEFDRRTRGA